MKIGIIETGEPPALLVPEHGTYPTMVRRLLGASHQYETFRVFEGAFPAARHGCDAFVITGSACGVKDGLSWIDDLIAFLRGGCGEAKLIGICFGHQVMAQAFGGNVDRAPKGWGLGLKRYAIVERAGWMDEVDAICGTASHQDQVLALPPNCRVLGTGAVTPYAILDYRDRPAMSVQFHPEFTPAFSRALFRMHRTPNLSQEDVESAVASLERASDNARLGRWMDRFLAT